MCVWRIPKITNVSWKFLASRALRWYSGIIFRCCHRYLYHIIICRLILYLNKIFVLLEGSSRFSLSNDWKYFNFLHCPSLWLPQCLHQYNVFYETFEWRQSCLHLDLHMLSTWLPVLWPLLIHMVVEEALQEHCQDAWRRRKIVRFSES